MHNSLRPTDNSSRAAGVPRGGVLIGTEEDFTTPCDKSGRLGCSAHYFEQSRSTLGVAWYGQGLRLLDISNARDVRQIGYYRVTGTDPATNPSSNSWDLEWNGRYVYLFDMNRGIEVLKLKRGTHDYGVSKLASVSAPSVRRDLFASVPVGGSARGQLVCPAFENSQAARVALREG